jgi:CRP-like cAMP-binding protein
MDYNILTQVSVFSGLNESEIRSVLQVTPHRVKRYPANSMIASSGDQVNNLMIILNGKVKGEMVDFAGRVIKIEDIPASGVLASAFMFGNNNKFPVNIISLVDTVILIIGRNDFLRLLKVNDRILVNFLNLISNRSQFLSEKIRFLNFKTIKGKLAQYILQIAGSRKNIIKLDRTQNDLADFFGVTRPSIARVISEMEEEGYFEAKGKNIKILDKEGLADLTAD